MIVAALLLSLWLPQPQTPCDDVPSCRTLAESAREANDYESFHDLAWATYRKGKSNDPELMLLVARAQSLSGRPGDALVMLERIAALGYAGDALTSEDFARVRALPRWPEVAEKLSTAPSAEAPAPSAKPPAPSAKEPAPSAKPPAPSAKEPAPSAKEPAPSAKPPAPSAKEPAPSAKPPAPSAKEPAPSAKSPAPSAKEPAPSAKPPEPLAFTTLLRPDTLAYDAVSRRFIIADRKARRVAVIDEHSGQVATLVGAQGALGEISGIAIDPSQGDLWVISASEDGASLHRLQLISGRMLSTVSLSIEDPVTAMAWVPGSGLVAADANGIVWGVRPDGRSQKLTALEYVPRAFAADARGRLYVAGGTQRLARFAVSSTLRKIDTIELDSAIPADAAFSVSGNRLHLIVPVQGSFEVRSFPVK